VPKQDNCQEALLDPKAVASRASWVREANACAQERWNARKNTRKNAHLHARTQVCPGPHAFSLYLSPPSPHLACSACPPGRRPFFPSAHSKNSSIKRRHQEEQLLINRRKAEERAIAAQQPGARRASR